MELIEAYSLLVYNEQKLVYTSLTCFKLAYMVKQVTFK